QAGELREALSLPEDATPQDLFDAVLEKLTAPEPAPESEPTPVATAGDDGVVAIDRDVLAALTARAARGEAAAQRQEADDRARLVDSAVQAGRIAPARREHWLNALAADPGNAEVLASLAPGLIPVSEIGHARVVDTVTDDAIYASLFGSEA
ncbi:Clp protease, partial [Rhodococcus jostii]